MYVQPLADADWSGAGRFTATVLHICLAYCQTNKGVRQPEVKQHTFPYCNHMAICQSLRTALNTASLLPPTSATQRTCTETQMSHHIIMWTRFYLDKNFYCLLWLSAFTHWFCVILQRWQRNLAEHSTQATAFFFPVLMSHSSLDVQVWVMTYESFP